MKKKLFAGFDDSELEAILPRLGCEVKEFKKGEYIFRENDLVDKIGVLLNGELLLTKVYPDGGESTFDVLFPAYTFGLDVAITDKRLSTFSILVSKPSVIAGIPFEYNSFLSALPAHLRIVMSANIIRYVSDENIRKQRQIEIISQKGLRDRISAYLEIMRDRSGNSFTIPYSREQLANYLCVNRSALSHELSLMRSEGLIDFRMNEFSIARGYSHSMVRVSENVHLRNREERHQNPSKFPRKM